MELTSSALTALFIGLVWTLIKVVEYFINRGKNDVVRNESEERDALISSRNINIINKIEHLQQQCAMLSDIYNKVKKLEESHSVVDENLIPRWYVPSELLPIVRQMHNSLDIMCRELQENLEAVKDGQASLVERILDLVSSQKIMVERLGDIIAKLNKHM